jgi:hypothetical protein
MIWFSCGKCGKTHGRPENSAGSLVFCECGQGNRVPWESTAAEPPPQAPVVSPAVPVTPTLAPLTFDLPQVPPLPSSRAEYSSRRRGETHDPNFCFNHPSTPKSAACEDCGEAFCASCLVALQGETLCGPCKNFRARGLELPPSSSTSATASLLIALLTGGAIGFCLLPIGGNAIVVLSLLALVPQLLAVGLGIRALYLAQHEGRTGGQAVAVTGITAAVLTIVLTVLVDVYYVLSA